MNFVRVRGCVCVCVCVRACVCVKVEAKLGECRAIKQGLIEDLELMHLTGKGIFMEKNQEVRSITLQSELDNQMKELGAKRKRLLALKGEFLDIYQGLMNMLRMMKAYAPQDLGLLILSENVLGMLRHQVNLEHLGSIPDDIDPHDMTTLFKHFEESLTLLNKAVNSKGGHHPSASHNHSDK